MNSLNGFSPRRKFVDNRNIKIAIQCHGKCTRDRSCRHNQDMRRTGIFCPQLGTLGYSETMLFVYHHQSQRRKVDSIFYYRMSTDKDMYISRHQIFQNCFPALSFYCSGKQLHPYIHTRQKTTYRFIMLSSQNFCRSHHASLIAIVQRNQHSHQGNKCFSAAHISLQQAVHLSSTSHVTAHLLYHPLLCSGKLERKILRIESIEYLSYFAKYQSAELISPFFGIAKNIKLDIKQLLELQTVLCSAEQLRVLREMNVIQRISKRHQPIMIHQLRTQGFFNNLLLKRPEKIFHQFLQRMRIEIAALHLFGRIIIRLKPHCRKSKLLCRINIRMSYIYSSIEYGRLAKDNIFFICLIFPHDEFQSLKPYQIDNTCSVGKMPDQTPLATFTHCFKAEYLTF